MAAESAHHMPAFLEAADNVAYVGQIEPVHIRHDLEHVTEVALVPAIGRTVYVTGHLIDTRTPSNKVLAYWVHDQSTNEVLFQNQVLLVSRRFFWKIQPERYGHNRLLVDESNNTLYLVSESIHLVWRIDNYLRKDVELSYEFVLTMLDYRVTGAELDVENRKMYLLRRAVLSNGLAAVLVVFNVDAPTQNYTVALNDRSFVNESQEPLERLFLVLTIDRTNDRVSIVGLPSRQSQSMVVWDVTGQPVQNADGDFLLAAVPQRTVDYLPFPESSLAYSLNPHPILLADGSALIAFDTREAGVLAETYVARTQSGAAAVAHIHLPYDRKQRRDAVVQFLPSSRRLLFSIPRADAYVVDTTVWFSRWSTSRHARFPAQTRRTTMTLLLLTRFAPESYPIPPELTQEIVRFAQWPSQLE